MATTSFTRREELIDLTPEDERILDRVWDRFRRNHPNHRPSEEYMAEMKRAVEQRRWKERPADFEERVAALRRHPHEVRR